MKSIKEKSFELFPEMQTDSSDWDVIEEQCDRDDQRKAFVKGANYVLDEIEKLVSFNRWEAQDLYELIDQLKSNQSMKRQDAINQYHTEVALFEQYGAINTTTFEEWLEIKNIKLED